MLSDHVYDILANSKTNVRKQLGNKKRNKHGHNSKIIVIRGPKKTVLEPDPVVKPPILNEQEVIVKQTESELKKDTDSSPAEQKNTPTPLLNTDVVSEGDVKTGYPAIHLIRQPDTSALKRPSSPITSPKNTVRKRKRYKKHSDIFT